MTKPLHNDSRQESDALRRLRNDYRVTFGTTEGRRVLWDILDNSYLLAPYSQENASAYKKEGKRENALYILGMMGLSNDIDSLSRLIETLREKERSMP